MNEKDPIEVIKAIAAQDTSPLVEAQPESIDELMSRDPMELTKDDIAKIVSILREQRKFWNVKQSAPKAKPAGPISLDQLKIEL